MTWVEIIRCRLAISSVAGIASLPHEPVDTARQKCFHYVSIVKCLRYFESVASSVVGFAGGHRTMYNRLLERLDTHFRKLCRSIVGPPPGTDWIFEWHELLHQ